MFLRIAGGRRDQRSSAHMCVSNSRISRRTIGVTKAQASKRLGRTAPCANGGWRAWRWRAGAGARRRGGAAAWLARWLHPACSPGTWRWAAATGLKQHTALWERCIEAGHRRGGRRRARGPRLLMPPARPVLRHGGRGVAVPRRLAEGKGACAVRHVIEALSPRSHAQHVAASSAAQVALVTGGGSGIGLEITRQLGASPLRVERLRPPALTSGRSAARRSRRHHRPPRCRGGGQRGAAARGGPGGRWHQRGRALGGAPSRRRAPRGAACTHRAPLRRLTPSARWRSRCSASARWTSWSTAPPETSWRCPKARAAPPAGVARCSRRHERAAHRLAARTQSCLRTGSRR